MRRVVVMSGLLLAAYSPAAARAQPPVPPAVPPAPVPVPAPASPPVQTAMTVTVQRVGGLRATALTGARLRVRGATAVFAPGETITVRFFIAGRKRAARRVTLQPGADGGGAFVLSYRPLRPGPLVVRATHDETPVLGAIVAKAPSVDVLPRRVLPRSGRASIRALQRRLKRLGYVTGAPGSFDARTARAVLAFRKVTAMARTTSASPSFMRKIARGAGHFAIRFRKHGRHTEADLSRQVIALIEDGRVRRIYPVSSGKPGTPTLRGSYRVYSKTPGTNAKRMVDAAYFFGSPWVFGGEFHAIGSCGRLRLIGPQVRWMSASAARAEWKP